jgi:hypothetical protein
MHPCLRRCDGTAGSARKAQLRHHPTADVDGAAFTLDTVRFLASMRLSKSVERGCRAASKSRIIVWRPNYGTIIPD